jgi:hypothetical protein
MKECQNYVNKPVPKEAVNSRQIIAGQRLFVLGVFHFLVDDKQMVTLAYKIDKKSGLATDR